MDASDLGSESHGTLRRLLKRPDTHAIITSETELEEALVPFQVRIGSLSKRDAIEFLRAEMPGVPSEELDAIVSLTGGLPLALRLVAGSYNEGRSDPAELIAALTESLSRVSAEVPGQSESALWLAERYLDRFAKSGSLNDAFEAEQVLRRMAAETGENRARTRVMSLLGALLGEEYLLTGSLDTLEESIHILRLALDAAPESHPDRPAMLSNLATTLSSLAERTGSAEHLEEAIWLLRRALDATPESHPDRPAMQSNLASASDALVAIRHERRPHRNDRGASEAPSGLGG